MNYVEGSRLGWMDFLRGVSIILVVVLHTYVVIKLKYPQVSDSVGLLVFYFAPIRMPLLMFLSGLLVFQSIEKGRKRFFLGKLQNVAYPFIVWTLIMAGLMLSREYFLGKPSDIILAEMFISSPLFHLWFLQYLICYYIIHWSFRSVSGLTIVAASLIIAYLSLGTDLSKFWTLHFAFALGSVLGRDLSRLNRAIEKSNAGFFVALLFFGTMLAIVLTGSRFSYSDETVSVALGVLAIPILIKLAMWADEIPGANLLRYIGRNSIVIYLAHMPLAMVYPMSFQNFYSGDINLIYPLYLLAVFFTCIWLVRLRNQSPVASLVFSPVIATELLSTIWARNKNRLALSQHIEAKLSDFTRPSSTPR